MGWFNWRRVTAALAVLAGGVAYAAGRGRREREPHHAHLLDDRLALPGALELDPAARARQEHPLDPETPNRRSISHRPDTAQAGRLSPQASTPTRTAP